MEEIEYEVYTDPEDLDIQELRDRWAALCDALNALEEAGEHPGTLPHGATDRISGGIGVVRKTPDAETWTLKINGE